MELLESLVLRSFKQSFGKLKKLGNNGRLKQLDLDGSMINDIEACQLVQLKTITFLSVNSKEMDI